MSAPSDSSHRSKKLQIALGILVSGACLGWAIYTLFSDPDARRKMAMAFQTANYQMLVPYLAALFGFYWLKAWRWRLLLKPLGDFQPTRQLMPPILIGFAFNNVLPAHAGEFVRVYVFGRRHNLKKTAVLTTLVLERVFDVFAIVTLLGLGLLFVKGADASLKTKGMIGGAAAFGMMIGSLAFVLWTGPVVKLTEAILMGVRIIPQKVVRGLMGLLNSAADGLSTLRNPRVLAAILGNSLLQWSLNGWLVYLSLAAFGLPKSLWIAWILLGTMAFMVTVPSTPGYFGVIQACFIAVMQLFTDESARETVFAASIFYHLAQYVPVTLAGLFFFARTGLSFAQVKVESEKAPDPREAGHAPRPAS